MRRFGLIGKSLKHSFSKMYFEEKFKKDGITDCSYELFELDDISGLMEFIARNNLSGLNVTIPYKEAVLIFLDKTDEKARLIGAVNTIKVVNDKGKILLEGFNTDYLGFMKSLEGLEIKGKKALILGTGGAAKAVAFALQTLGIDYMLVSRNPKEKQTGYDDLNEETVGNHQIIINATPLGMFPNVNSYPEIPYEFITSRHLLYDLVYNPEETVFLRRGKERGAKTINGRKMFELQAELSWKIWNQKGRSFM